MTMKNVAYTAAIALAVMIVVERSATLKSAVSGTPS